MPKPKKLYPLEIEVWPSATYIRITEEKVAKTVSQKGPKGIIANVDLDSSGDLIGIELIGLSLDYDFEEEVKQAKERQRFLNGY